MLAARPLPFFIVALFVFQIALGLQLRVLTTPWVEPPVEQATRWDPDVFKAVTFGQWASGIDWLWIKTILDPSITHLPKGTHPAVYYDLDLATDLDPAFHDLYVGGARLLAVIRDDGPGARDLLLKAERFLDQGLNGYPALFRENYWPMQWDISLLLAYVDLFEFSDLKSASVQFKSAASQPGSPRYLSRLSQRLLMPGGEYEVGLKLLAFMITTTSDERTKAKLRVQYESLKVASYLFELNGAFRKFLGNSVRDRHVVWREYLNQTGNPAARDPFGGELSLSSEGRVVTSTPHEAVLGLE